MTELHLYLVFPVLTVFWVTQQPELMKESFYLYKMPVNKCRKVIEFQKNDHSASPNKITDPGNYHQQTKSLNERLMGKFSMGVSGYYHLNPLMNLDIIKSRTTRYYMTPGMMKQESHSTAYEVFLVIIIITRMQQSSQS